MHPPPAPSIVPVTADGFDAFLHYLRRHVAGNGADGRPHFQPLPRGTPLDEASIDAFRRGLELPVGTPGWRGLWVARDPRPDGGVAIAGHVDLRGPREAAASHRCLLGMGVDDAARGRGLGRRLLAHAIDAARAEPTLHWLDLMVLADNAPAVRLYRAAGFRETGRTDDHFRLDGVAVASLAMTLAV